VPEIFLSSTFAAFLAKIGPRNSRSITHLALWSTDPPTLTKNLPLITELARLHMPNLRDVEVLVEEEPICYSESPDYYDWDGFAGLGREEEFGDMYCVLDDFVGKIDSLRKFEYEGEREFGLVNEDPGNGWEALKALESGSPWGAR